MSPKGVDGVESKKRKRRRTFSFIENCDSEKTQQKPLTDADFIDVIIRIFDTISIDDYHRLRTLQEESYDRPKALSRLKIKPDTLRATIKKAVKIFRISKS